MLSPAWLLYLSPQISALYQQSQFSNIYRLFWVVHIWLFGGIAVASHVITLCYLLICKRKCMVIYSLWICELFLSELSPICFVTLGLL